MKVWFLKIHRWLALVFGLPLIVVILSGLVLSFEPWLVTNAIENGALPQEKIQTLLTQHDPDGRARSLFYRNYDNTVSIGAGRGQSVVVDVATGQVQPGPSTLASVMGTARGLHEALLIDANWLVVTSTAALLATVLLGALLGWPRFSNTLSGWHKGVAWGLFPFVALSPLTGLLMTLGVTFAAAPASAPAPQAAPLALYEAVAVVGRDHDLSSLIWMRSMGGRLLARLAEDGEYRVYAVTAEGTAPMQRNWPRLWHEGNFAGAWSAAMNVIVSFAMMGLLATGVWIWLRRSLRRHANRRGRHGATA